MSSQPLAAHGPALEAGPVFATFGSVLEASPTQHMTVAQKPALHRPGRWSRPLPRSLQLILKGCSETRHRRGVLLVSLGHNSGLQIRLWHLRKGYVQVRGIGSWRRARSLHFHSLRLWSEQMGWQGCLAQSAPPSRCPAPLLPPERSLGEVALGSVPLGSSEQAAAGLLQAGHSVGVQRQLRGCREAAGLQDPLPCPSWAEGRIQPYDFEEQTMIFCPMTPNSGLCRPVRVGLPLVMRMEILPL